jgi:hypothetical protein
MSIDITKLPKDAFYQSVTVKEDFPACFSMFIADLSNNSQLPTRKYPNPSLTLHKQLRIKCCKYLFLNQYASQRHINIKI